MALPSKASGNMRFRNVTVYSGGKAEHGTLYLTPHHLKFSYTPKTQPLRGVAKDESPHPTPATSKESSNVTDVSTSSNEAKDGQERGKPLDQQPSSRAKEIWVPYPMINFCILRPSHASVNSAQQSLDRGQVETNSDDDELFPPVFGTASFYGRPSTDSTHLAPHSSPARPSTPTPVARMSDTLAVPDSGRQPAIRIRRRDFQMMAFHFHSSTPDSSPDEQARQAFFILRSRCCIHKVEDLHAFHFEPPKQETSTTGVDYDARREFARMGIGEKAAEGPGTAWRITSINQDYSYSPTYPSVLCVPRAVSDNMLKYGGSFRSRSRIPALAYLHPNGGSITRSSQPMVGVQNKRNPQDERLVSAIFSSHTPPLQPPETSAALVAPGTALENEGSDLSAIEQNDAVELSRSQSDTALDEAAGANPSSTPRKKVYGSTRQNLIVDARPKINALANRATGGGIEDVANYMGAQDMPIQKVFLNIANIHVMRASLDKIIESLSSADYMSTKPNAELLRKSGWLGHIAGLLEGSETVARVVGLGGSHALVHCSDGWDRTAQVSALAQVMLDPHCRTLNGFIALIQKDFLSFGHKFRDRNGIEGSEKWFEIENERITPSPRSRESSAEQSSLNVLGSRALSGAKNWLEKNRGNLFRQQNSSRESLADLSSQASSPPPNPLIHSPPSAPGKDESSHRMSEKEIAPIFHQFLDAIFQLQHQSPTAFEFNERFLRRLFYHTYACQYGEFLFNTEKDRNQHKDKYPSVWAHFLSRRHEFANPDYIAQTDDPLLFPLREGPEREIQVRWWSALFHCRDEDMNVPRALAPQDPPPSSTPSLPSTASVSLDERVGGSGGGSGDAGEVAATAVGSASGGANGTVVKESKSTPSLGAMRESLTAGVAALTTRSPQLHKEQQVIEPSMTEWTPVQRDPVDSTTDIPPSETLLPTSESLADASGLPETVPNSNAESGNDEGDGDPLGVSNHVSPRASLSGTGNRGTPTKGLDFAAFASQNAFRDH